MKLLSVVWVALFGIGAAQGPSGSISGTVRVAGGVPQAGVRVAAMAVPQADIPQSDSTVLVSITQTDSTGRYRLENVPPGRYYIMSGIVSAPTYYPGSLDAGAASIVTMAAGSDLTGYDFTSIGPTVAPRQSVARRLVFVPGPDGPAGRIITVRIVTEDGSPLPTVPITVNFRNSGLSGGGSLQGDRLMLRLSAGETQFSIGGLPLGYELTSIRFGNVDRGLGPVKIDAVSPGDVVMTLAVTPLSAIQGVRVSGRLTNIAPEWTLRNRAVRLTSMGVGGPTIETPLNPDNSFEFAKVPAGAYRASLGGLPSGDSSLPIVNVTRGDIKDVAIDFRNNPFPEYPGGAYSPVFDVRNAQTLRGVVTQAVTQIYSPAPFHYFRMDVKDQGTGITTSWAVLVTAKTSPAELMNSVKLAVGSEATVTGKGSRDGTHRLSVDNLLPATARINGLPVPNLSAP